MGAIGNLTSKAVGSWDALISETGISQYQQTASQDIQKKQADLLRPLIEKARAAIQKVARAQGFEYVIDGTQGGSLILSDGKDLMEDVKKELGF